MTQIAQPYNLFAQQKQQGYNSYQQPQQAQQQVTAPYNPMGETVQDFAAGKQAANSQAQGYGANPVTPTQTFTQPQSVGAAKDAVKASREAGNKVWGDQGTGTLGEYRNQNKPITSMEDLATAMGYTSPKQEEKLRKASVANQRILAVGDALRHIGNIFNTVRYAPAQKFNSPVQEEYERYQRGKALRDKANLTYLNYQQQKAIQDAKQKQWEQQFRYNAAKDAATAQALKEYREAGLKEKGRQFDEGLAYRAKNDEANRKQRGEHYKEQERQGRQRIGIAAQNSRNMETHRQWVRENKGKGGSAGVAPLDTPKGQITPNGRSYSNQLLQMFDYARSRGLVKESDVAKRLREMGYGKDQSDNVKRQMVMDLLRTNPDMGDYAANRLGWSYGGGNALSIGWDDDDEEDVEDNGLEIGW